MWVQVICNYCDERWPSYIKSSKDTGEHECPRCKETKNFRIVNLKSDIDYYAKG